VGTRAIPEEVPVTESAVRTWLATLVEALPLGLVLVVAAFLVERDGGFAGTVRAPTTLLLLGIATAVALGATRVLVATPRPARIAFGCLGGLVLWSFLGLAWSGMPAQSWDGANRMLLYLVVFGLVACWPVGARTVWPLLLAAGVVVAVEGLVTAQQAAHAADPTQFMIGSRLSEPLGYPNATGALFMTMLWLMIGVGSRRFVPAPARGLAIALAGLFSVLNLLTESRGSVYTLPLVAAVYFVLVPGRLRSLATAVLVAIPLTIEVRPVLHVFNGGAEELPAHLRHAIELGVGCAAALLVVGTLLALADARLEVSPRTTRRVGAGILAALAVAAVVALAVFRPWNDVGSAWHTFKYRTEPGGTTHFGGLGSNRYDFWRVGLQEFRAHPVVGVGIDNFLVPYLKHRRSAEEPLYSHSLVVDLLSQTGLIGTALAVAFLAFVVLGVLRIRAGPARELATIAVAGASVVILHGAVDWLWQMPVLGVLGMALLGLACALVPRPGGERDGAPHRTVLVAAPLAAVAVAAAVSLVLPWIAERETNLALKTWPTDHAAGISMLDRARALNPLSNTPDVLAGALAGRLGDYGLMRARYARAVRRSPDDWYANLELGIAASLTGDRSLAGSSLRKAVDLNPREPVVNRVLRAFEAGRRIDSAAVDRQIANETE
jgi:O-antigen ligase